MNEVVETGERIAKGWLNGTSRAQAYTIMAITAVSGAAAGVAGTVAFIKHKFVLVSKTELEKPTVVVGTPE